MRAEALVVVARLSRVAFAGRNARWIPQVAAGFQAENAYGTSKLLFSILVVIRFIGWICIFEAIRRWRIVQVGTYLPVFFFTYISFSRLM